MVNIPTPPRQHDRRRSRNQFRAWLVFELNKRGANLPSTPSYSDLLQACERILPKVRP